MVSFSANFSLSEFERVSDRAPSIVEKEKAAQLSMLGDVIRRAQGDRALVVTSWLRGDNSESGHFSGDAADFRLTSALSQRALYDRITAAMFASGLWWGELIFYPFGDRHLHLTLYPVGGVRQVLITDEHGNYRTPAPDLIARIPGAPSGTVAGGGGGAALAIVALTLGAVAWAARGVPA